MAFTDKGVQPPFGLHAGDHDVFAYNRTGATRAVGDVVMFDTGLASTEATEYAFGSEASAYANVTLPTSTAALGDPQVWGLFGIIVGGSLADNGLLKVRVRGRCPANVTGTAATVTGQPLIAVNAQDTLDSDHTANHKVIAIAENSTAGATEEQIDVIIDGINGFGQITG